MELRSEKYCIRTSLHPVKALNMWSKLAVLPYNCPKFSYTPYLNLIWKWVSMLIILVIWMNWRKFDIDPFPQMKHKPIATPMENFKMSYIA